MAGVLRTKWPLHLHPQGDVFCWSVENHLFVPTKLPRMTQEESKYICIRPKCLNALQFHNLSTFSLSARGWEFGKKAHARNSLLLSQGNRRQSRLRQNACLLLHCLHKRGASRESKSRKTFEVIYSCLPFALDGEIRTLTLGKRCQQTRTDSLCPAAQAPPHPWGAKAGIKMVNDRTHTCRTRTPMPSTKQRSSLP